MRCQRVLGVSRDGGTIRRHTRRGLAIGIKKLISIALCVFLLAPNIAYSVVYASETVIEADGRTSTTITPSGDVTEITTTTIVDQNAFNSFSRFNIGSGHTVNLQVPSGADNLLNLVHSERSQIYGVLNSIKDGQIGGNVFFLNPYGVVVGSSDSIATAGNVELVAGGTISQTGDAMIENAALLTTRSIGGQTLTGANTVKSFRAVNTEDGQLVFRNTSDVLLVGVEHMASEDVSIIGEANLVVRQVTGAAATVSLIAAESTVAGSTESSHIDAENINLVSETGSIGGATDYLRIDKPDASPGAVKAKATKDIYLAEIDGDLNVDRIKSAAGSIYVEADGSILDAIRGDIVNFEGVNITLTAKNGSVGDETSRITTAAAEKTNVRAVLNIYLMERYGDLWADYSRIDAQVEDLALLHILVGRHADITNRHHRVVAENVEMKLYDCELQLRPESLPFNLFMKGDRQIMSNGQVFNYDDDYIVNEFSTENSTVRMAKKVLEKCALSSNWLASYYESALVSDLSAGRTSVVLSVVESDAVCLDQFDYQSGDIDEKVTLP